MKKQFENADCSGCIMAVSDALEALNGKWKLPILVSLKYGNKRFKQISTDVGKITDRMLSKELKELEMNQLISRTIIEEFPPRVEYSITKHGDSLSDVITSLRTWGVVHRKKIMGR